MYDQVKAVYLTVFFIGMVGFVAMIAMGSFHGHGMGGSHATQAIGHAGTHAVGHGHGIAHSGVKAVQSSPTGFSKVLFLLSPIHIFSMAVGFGTTGVLLHALLIGDWLFFSAVVGGLAFDILAVKPLMGFLGNFASKPSEGLAGSVLQEAEAVTGFDLSGKGIVRLTLDGQFTQLLATLDQGEIDKGVRVQKGQRVIVVDVDTSKNTCRVTRELAS